jgi:hypothetical protein
LKSPFIGLFYFLFWPNIERLVLFRLKVFGRGSFFRLTGSTEEREFFVTGFDMVLLLVMHEVKPVKKKKKAAIRTMFFIIELVLIN